MPEASYYQDGDTLDYTPAAALSSGQVIQVPDGRAAMAVGDIAAGVQGAVQVSGARICAGVRVSGLHGVSS